MRVAKTRRRKGIVLKVMAGSQGISLRITSTFLVLVAVLLGLVGWQARVWLDRGASRYQTQIQELEKANSQYRAALALKEREKEQMLALAEEKFEELRSQLQSQDQELAQIGRVVGSSATTRRTLKGSRSGRNFNSLRMKVDYRKLMAAVEGRESDLDQLRVAALDYRKRVQRQREAAALNATPSLWPCRGSLSSGFGWRIHPVYGYGRMHTGVDISAPFGTPIVATAAGRVIQSGWLSGYGYAITVDHGNGLSTLYAHCSSLAYGVGAFIRKGQTIAYVGSTGISTGPHVHYEVLANGSQVNPAPYLLQKEPPVSVANHNRQGG